MSKSLNNSQLKVSKVKCLITVTCWSIQSLWSVKLQSVKGRTPELVFTSAFKQATVCQCNRIKISHTRILGY